MISSHTMAKLIKARETREKFLKELKNIDYLNTEAVFGSFRTEGDYRALTPFTVSEESSLKIKEFVLEELKKDNERLLIEAEEDFKEELLKNVKV